MRGWVRLAGLMLVGWLLVAGAGMIFAKETATPNVASQELHATSVVLTDKATGKNYSLSVSEGRLVLVDLAKRQAFVMMELPDAKPAKN